MITQDQRIEFLEELARIADETGLELEIEAADYVLLHYNMWDYQGKDKEFVDFCDRFSKGLEFNGS